MPRITFEVTESTHQVLCRIPHGFRKYAYRWLIEGYAEYLARDPVQALHDLMSHQIEAANLIEPGVKSGEPTVRAKEPALS